MAFTTPTAEDLGLALDLDQVDGPRADFLIQKAIELCESIVTPLPDGAAAVVIAVAGRAYDNFRQNTYQTLGPASAQQPPAAGGLYLSRADKSTLKRLAGRGGAFTIDPTPATADPSPTFPSYDLGWS